jgi:hypothetical protein
VKTAATLVNVARIATAAVALALVVAAPTAHSALAAGDPGNPPPASTTPVPHPPSGPLRTAKPDPMVFIKETSPLDTAGHFTSRYAVKNVGMVTSKPILVYTYCRYEDGSGNSVEVAANPLKVLQPMTTTADPFNLTVECGPKNDVWLIGSKAMIVSEDDATTNNNMAFGHPLI